MNFELRAWVNNGESYSEANSRLCVSVANALLAAGINIPHQQQDVYIKHYTREK
jgi:small-conductance mechanosensitive channel